MWGKTVSSLRVQSFNWKFIYWSLAKMIQVLIFLNMYFQINLDYGFVFKPQ